MVRPSIESRPQRVTLARMCRDGRQTLGWSQARLAAAIRSSRSHVAAIELGRANPSLEIIARLAVALGFELDLVLRPPIVVGDRRQRDAVHARASGYVDRRLVGDGWLTDREVEIVDGRWRGWIDLLAFDPRTGTLLVIEIKTRIDDLGAIERQLGWYARVARRLARSRGWEVRQVQVWLLVLASDEVEDALRADRDILERAFPLRAAEMRRVVAGQSGPPGVDRRPVARGSPLARGLALVDPARRRRDWLIPTKLDGRRSPAPYRDYRDAAARSAPAPRPTRTPARPAPPARPTKR